ncbi:MAG: GtrA family protein [Saprospiraceae bacterium]|nr:GtrA family protein [Saprospiraceae bacterium]
MMNLRGIARDFILPKAKFASTSLLATIVDYTLYLALYYAGLGKISSNIISASCGFLVNFFLQKKFIFALKRKVRTTFLLSMSFSIIGIAVSTLLIYWISKIEFFDDHQYVTKGIVTGIMFFYNYYTKQIAFEKKVNKL